MPTSRAVEEVPPTAQYVNRLSLELHDRDSEAAGGGVSRRGGTWKSNTRSGRQAGPGTNPYLCIQSLSSENRMITS